MNLKMVFLGYSVTLTEVILFVAVFFFGRFLIKRRFIEYKGQIFPGPKGHFLIGHAFDLWLPPKALFRKIDRLCKQYSRMFGLWLGPIFAAILYDPVDVTKVLTSKFTKKSQDYEFMQPWIGTGLLATLEPDASYRAHKRLILPALNQNTIREFLEVFNRQSNALVEKLKNHVDGMEFNALNYLRQFSVHTLLETEMGLTHDALGEKALQYSEGVEMLCHIIHLRTYNFYLRPNFIFKFSKHYQVMTETIKKLHTWTDQVIKSKKSEILKSLQESDAFGQEEDTRRSVFLEILIEASLKAEGYKEINSNNVKVSKQDILLSDKELRDEVLTLMFAGQDTTTVSNGFILSMLGLHPEIQARVQQELDEIFGDSDRPVVWEDLAKMNYLERVIQETWRMYPPVPIIARTPTQDIKLGSYILPKSSTAAMLLMQMHRNPAQFPNPEVFDPDRFLPERIQERHPNAFIPFGMGIRMCIGAKYSMAIIKVAISTVMRHYTVTSLRQMKTFQLTASTTLKRREGFPIILHKRNKTEEFTNL